MQLFGQHWLLVELGYPGFSLGVVFVGLVGLVRLVSRGRLFGQAHFFSELSSGPGVLASSVDGLDDLFVCVAEL